MPMIQKALLIDFKDNEIGEKYLNRLLKIIKSYKLLPSTDPKLWEEAKDAEMFLVKISTKIDKPVIDASPKLKYIGTLSTAFDAVDAKYAKKRKITVCNLGGYSTEAVAEFAIATIMEQTRELERAKIQARDQDFSFNKFMGLELKDKVLGVVGAGKIGSRIAELGVGFGMKVLYFATTKKPKLDKLGAKKIMLKELLSKSDFITIALSLNQETRGMVDKKMIASIKDKAVVVNVAPPDLLDQEAIIKACNDGKISFIFDHSDDLDEVQIKRFLQAKNCIVYPPIAFRTSEANTARWETFVSNVEAFVKGNPQNVVN